MLFSLVNHSGRNCLFPEVDDEDEEDEDEAEDGYEEIVRRDKEYLRSDEGPSAREIEDRMRRKDLWGFVLTLLTIDSAAASVIQIHVILVLSSQFNHWINHNFIFIV